MTSATNRRAVMGAVLAAGAVGATAVLPAAGVTKSKPLRRARLLIASAKALRL